MFFLSYIDANSKYWTEIAAAFKLSFGALETKLDSLTLQYLTIDNMLYPLNLLQRTQVSG